MAMSPFIAIKTPHLLIASNGGIHRSYMLPRRIPTFIDEPTPDSAVSAELNKNI
jgi:hypothetical protein